MTNVIKQNWLESEAGWGQKPDGYSLHLTSEDCKAYIKDYWATMPSQVPDFYERPCGEPQIITVETDVYNRVKKSKNGIRIYS